MLPVVKSDVGTIPNLKPMNYKIVNLNLNNFLIFRFNTGTGNLYGPVISYVMQKKIHCSIINTCIFALFFKQFI
jgi:hypothetical protein